MQHMIGSLIVLGTLLGVEVGAEPMVAGQVRLASGEPVAGVHVRLFDLRDLRSWVSTTTDETGSFALPVGALPGAAVQPTQFSLGENYPNPFNPATVIPYRLHQPMSVRLEVFNVLGQNIATLVDGQQSAGLHTARWGGTDAAGAAVAAGVYLYRLSSEGVQATRSMVLIDGQAGVPAGSSGRMPQAGVETTEAASVYGLTVSGPGLIPFVDPAFRVATGPVELVVEASAGLSRAKAASSGSCFSGGVLGDVDNNSRVDFFDALLVALYSRGSSTVMPNNGDISLGDVNADDRIDSTDAYLIAAWLNDPSDPMLPAGIGEGGGGIASPDCAALVALYEATDGDNWENNTNWLSDAPLGEWFGVTTDDDGRVTQLELGGNQLSGVLPSELGDLTHLQVLYLYENELSAELPESLGNLTNLRELDLYENDFSGSLPSELGNLTNLEVLYLDHNPLSGGLPSELVNLTYLKWLNLRNTQLCAPGDADFQVWLDGIENKRGVVICDEDEGDEPDDRAALVALYEATDGDNWTDNTNWLSDRPLGEWYGVTTDGNGRVARLDLSENALSGSLPASLGNLTNLQELDLSENALSGSLPASLGNLTNLQRLSFFRNQFSGALPAWLGNLINLQRLDLGYNEFAGPLPPELGELTNLQWLSLNDNPLSGALPSSFVNLTNLEVLLIHNTQLCVPPDFAFQPWPWVQPLVISDDVAICGEDPDPINPDRAALVALYEATDGDNWTNKTNWLSDEPLGEWFGVDTNNGRVTRLNLDSNALSGALPSSLGDLTNLQELDLYNNQLSGSLPSSLGNLTNLTWLNLHINALSGALPSSLGDLINLQTLLLSGNEFSGSLPSSLGNLTHLQTLWLANNQLSGSLPSSLGNLTHLESLVLAGNEFSGSLPASLSNLTNLQELWLGDNEFSGELPSWLGNLTNLQELWLSYNEFSGSLPASLVNLANLEVLDLRDTQLCAPTDAAFQAWLEGLDDKQGVVNCGGPPDRDRAALVALYEATDGANWTNKTNWLSDQPLGEWHGVDTNANGRVTDLGLYDNGLSGALPAELGNLTNLERLSFFRNQLSGSIPSSLVNLTNLEWLSLDFNDLSGSVPSWLGNLTNLESLRLGNNNFSGSVPSSLVNLTSLSTLGLNDNDFSGSVPSWLGNLTNLRVLWLGYNDFSGSIPSSLGSLTNLESLDLRGLQLSGALPAWLGNLTNLEVLDLRDNALSGTIPPWLSNLTNLQSLLLGDNALSGALPASLVNLSDLTTLELYNTQLCAPLDADFQTWLEGIDYKSGVVNCEDPEPSNPDRAVLVALYEATNGDNWKNNTNWLSDKPLSQWYGVTTDDDGRVTHLELGGNDLSGELPSELVNLTHLQRLSLYDNELSGGVPSWLGSLTQLRLLSLNHNEFSGSIPSELGNLTQLQELYLLYNELSGTIPSSLGSLTQLRLLDLSHNELSGALPASLGNLTNLRVLVLADNELSGTIPSWLGNLTHLQVLTLGGNEFSGTLPSSLGNLTNLRTLYLPSLRLSGSIPSWLINLTNLEWLGLYDNELSGGVPSWLGNLTHLQVLYLYDNELSGALPASLVNLTNLEWLGLWGTQLCAPADATFQAWLEGIQNKSGVRNCGEQGYDDDGNLRLVEGVEMEPLVYPEVFGGTPPLMYSMSGLPPGLSFDPETRTLSGTPTEAGRYEVTFRVEDATGQSAEQPLIVIVEPSGG